MNFNNILHDIAKADPEIFDRVSPRRATIRTFLRGASLAALPVALGGLFKKAYGQGSPNNALIIETLNFALTAEYLESEFYTEALSRTTLIFPNATLRNGVELLRQNETAHRDFVIATIQQLGGTPISKPQFDFTGGNGSNSGPFADVFINPATFFAVAQAFEETGVRAYKGQAANLMSSNQILTAALNIHSVEGRHVSWLRKVRRENFGASTLKPWITGNQSGINSSAVQPVYNGEENTTQGGVQVVGLNGLAQLTASVVSEAFDEPLTKAEVLTIVDPFIVP